MKFSDLYKLEEDSYSGPTNSIVTIPEGVKVINEGDVYKDVKILNLPKSLEVIEDSAFKDCVYLKEINFPKASNLKNISHRAFMNCRSLEKVVLPNKVRVIGNSAFLECTNLKEIQLSNNLSRIFGNAFRNCKSLERLVIPKKVKEIDDRILSGATSMKELIITGDVDNIRPCAFCLEEFESDGYSISFETNKKYPLSIISYAKTSTKVPPTSSLIVRDCDIARLKTESIDYDSAEAEEIINNSLLKKTLTIKGLLSSSYLDKILSNFEMLKDYLYDDLEKITPDDFNRLKKHFSPENINNIYSIFRRFFTLNNTGNIVSYISDIVGTKELYRENSENDESQVILSDLSIEIIKLGMESCKSREEAFEEVKSSIELEVPNASDEFINKIVDKYYKGEDGNQDTTDIDSDDARSLFDRETENIAAAKEARKQGNIKESKKKMFNHILKRSI